jgi:hypothetical protein
MRRGTRLYTWHPLSYDIITFTDYFRKRQSDNQAPTLHKENSQIPINNTDVMAKENSNDPTETF